MTTARTDLAGIHVPLITPFESDGRIATDALERLAHQVLADGAVGLVALGTTAETATLTEQERVTVLDICASVCRARGATLIVGAGGNDTAGSARALDRLSRWPGVSAALVPVPSFTRPSKAGVVAHFTYLQESSPVPLIVYHVPYRTACDLDSRTLRELGALPGVVAVKYAAGSIDAAAVELFADLPDDFAVLAGDDLYLTPLLALGASGGILASAHVSTGDFVGLVKGWDSGDVDNVRDLGRRLSKLSGALFSEPNPTVIKGVLHALGQIPTPHVRLPLLPASDESVDRALEIYRS
ncbi:dihydrodipicolinate synthase family protein [Rhodococcus sp. IEGM 1409]|uniref:dihydrodipicolinate synthase family protein n=1 Tax=Rhodococcus sp. IEGM 1409 TaxID=3047082 RepID=UPI0024B66777|nr:dihydrodipicolinate synthase family protein [Rhodococcus sp. IEGM 1409]MDI9900718.1 dihydrodipicolinate synthase family protein [Rhodococcus sp. IEGM 1409]